MNLLVLDSSVLLNIIYLAKLFEEAMIRNALLNIRITAQDSSNKLCKFVCTQIRNKF